MAEQLKILIVDDDQVDRMAVKRALNASPLQVEVVEVQTCQAAQTLLATTDFSCILLDYRLPDGNALGIINYLKGLERMVPTVVLTGQGDEKIAVDLMKAGAADYLSKMNLSPELLSKSIRSALRIFRAEQQTAEINLRLRNSNLLLQAQNHQLETQKQKIHLQNLQLVQASHLKSQFLASMSHELRTPMHAIMGFSQILLQGVKGPLNPSQEKMVERILGNSSHLLELLNDLLDFSKVEAGKLTLEVEEFNVVKSAISTVEELRSLADQKGLQLTYDIQLQDRKLLNDKSRLRQILVNLLSNAIKFTTQGSVSLKLFEAEDGRVAIAIQDTGIGIDAQQFEDIFDAFRQVHQTVSRKYPGTGLGLAISKSLVQMMQGEIVVESQLGQGSTFTVLLPRTFTKPVEDEALPPAQDPSVPRQGNSVL